MQNSQENLIIADYKEQVQEYQNLKRTNTRCFNVILNGLLNII